MGFGGWSIDKEVLDYLPAKGSHILELGSGSATLEYLERGYKVTAVEHEPKWVGKYNHPNLRYIYAPLVQCKDSRFQDLDLWYDPNVLSKELPQSYDLIIVDGPPGVGQRRCGFVKHIDLFKPTRTIVDDVHRNEFRIAIWISRLWKYDVFIPCPEGFKKRFAVCAPKGDLCESMK